MTLTAEPLEFDGDEVWFTSDTHLSHARIIELSGRPFVSVEEMNETLIERWNATVPADATVIHLGDLAMGTLADSLPLTAHLNGRKKLVPGNHDRVSQAFDRGKAVERFMPVYEAAGWTILPEQTRVRLSGMDALLCHFPYDGDSQGADRYESFRPVDDGLPLIHGHIHEAGHIRGRQFNVGVDVNDFAPVSGRVIADWLLGLNS